MNLPGRKFWSILFVWMCLLIFYPYWTLFLYPESLDYRIFDENRQTFVKTEEFEYATLEALKSSGRWTYNEKDFVKGNSISISEGELTLKNDGTDGWAFVWKDWDVGDVYSWKYEAMAKLVGEDSNDLLIGVVMFNSSGPIEYVFSLAGSSYIFRRNHPDGEDLSIIPGYRAIHDRWFTFALERHGSVFKTFFNDYPIDEIALPNLGHLIEFAVSTGTNSTTKFERVTMEHRIGWAEDQETGLYLLPDMVVFIICFALSYIGYKASSQGRIYILVSVPIFLNGLAGLLLFMLKFGLLAHTAVILIVSGMIGFVMGLFRHAYSQ